MRFLVRSLVSIALGTAAAPLAAQTFPVDNPVLRQIWSQGMDSSQTWPLAQALFDSIGPRLTGSPGLRAGQQWLRAMYDRWGITARTESYGTWRGWRRGITHIDLVQPRVRSLEGMMLAWSPGTKGTVEAGTVILPDLPDSASYQLCLYQEKCLFVLVSYF
jgi:carboxypeptidase Q